MGQAAGGSSRSWARPASYASTPGMGTGTSQLLPGCPCVLASARSPELTKPARVQCKGGVHRDKSLCYGVAMQGVGGIAQPPLFLMPAELALSWDD